MSTVSSRIFNDPRSHETWCPRHNGGFDCYCTNRTAMPTKEIVMDEIAPALQDYDHIQIAGNLLKDFADFIKEMNAETIGRWPEVLLDIAESVSRLSVLSDQLRSGEIEIVHRDTIRIAERAVAELDRLRADDAAEGGKVPTGRALGHSFVHSAKLGGAYCQNCGAMPSLRRGKAYCANPASPDGEGQ